MVHDIQMNPTTSKTPSPICYTTHKQDSKHDGRADMMQNLSLITQPSNSFKLTLFFKSSTNVFFQYVLGGRYWSEAFLGQARTIISLVPSPSDHPAGLTETFLKLFYNTRHSSNCFTTNFWRCHIEPMIKKPSSNNWSYDQISQSLTELTSSPSQPTEDLLIDSLEKITKEKKT
ncbi:hypothetical protein HELRODRAFT_162551 [Helobdella robusta]|uniref:Uncharacterized protein n=1 Tax=Helobdella robusta TaxID=6412 RepID=T1EST8_HELRO|nr:hypothetical protein HELRODRAFT_162551 [Helobdella robusta]ESN99068.1 hypothetical protein HELRODRAFT_162551 [Helobdella robusta]